ncbi:unnamed protein product [Tenebrio molitor]|nr:unnamed protein product [Tenebrio molitor]CAH1384641.1 unnamed protein product [Tenebrio molitor]
MTNDDARQSRYFRKLNVIQSILDQVRTLLIFHVQLFNSAEMQCVSTKNRHLKTMHNEKVEERKSQHIKCPICSEERKELLANHDSLIQHLTKVHSVSIEQYNFSFRNMEEFKLEEHRKVEKWIMLILQV